MIKRFYIHTVLSFLHFMPITLISSSDCVLDTSLPTLAKFPESDRVGQALFQFLPSCLAVWSQEHSTHKEALTK